MSAAIFDTGSKATTTPVALVVSRVFAFSMQAEQPIVVDPKSPGGINSPHGLILFENFIHLSKDSNRSLGGNHHGSCRGEVLRRNRQ
jgi:hypothetical protein